MNRSSPFQPTQSNRSSGGMRARCAARNARPEAGFSLLEALVTLAILSVGLMGLAFLQAQGMQFNTSAYARTQASILASDIIDRMRLNAGNVGDYDTSSFSEDPASCDVLAAPDADNDRNCWYQRLESALPAGDGGITVNGAVVTVTVSWRERPGGRQEGDFDPASLDEAELIQNMSMSVTL